MNKEKLLSIKMLPANKLVLIFLAEWPTYLPFIMRSAEIGKALGLSRKTVLTALEDLQIDGFIETTKDGYSRYRSTKITSKTKQLILND